MDLVKLIKDAIEAKPADAPRPYIGASSIGNPCSRAIWYSFKGALRPEIPASLQTTFEVGKRLEGMLLDYVELANLTIERPSDINDHLFLQDPEVPIFQGHCDAILNLGDGHSAILEIKTAKNSSFNTFKKDGLRKWSPYYYGQLQAYMGMAGCREGVLLAMNKDSSELHQEWINFDESYYLFLRDKASSISEATDAPVKFNSSPLHVVCRMCNYKGTCHG